MYTFFGSAAKTRIRSLNYSDTEVMARVAAASGITDDAKRMAEYQALEKKIVVDDAAWFRFWAAPTYLRLAIELRALSPTGQGSATSTSTM